MVKLLDKYPNIMKCLQGLKGLTEKEAEAYFEICSKKSVSVKEIEDIFVEIKASVSRSKAYTIVEKFKKVGLIFNLTNSSKKQVYKAIHPRSLLNELKQNLKDVDKEVTKLAESYETSDFEMKDPRASSRTLESESEISSVCNVLSKKGKLFIIHNKILFVK